jgi:hypothetical protein
MLIVPQETAGLNEFRSCRGFAKSYVRAGLGDYEIHRLSLASTQHCDAADARHVIAAIFYGRMNLQVKRPPLVTVG